jgi:hypothetical protein
MIPVDHSRLTVLATILTLAAFDFIVLFRRSLNGRAYRNRIADQTANSGKAAVLSPDIGV